MATQIQTIRPLIDRGRTKNFKVTLLFVDFFKAFDPILRGNMYEILLAYGFPKEIVIAILCYKNAKVKVHSSDEDIDSDIAARVFKKIH